MTEETEAQPADEQAAVEPPSDVPSNGGKRNFMSRVAIYGVLWSVIGGIGIWFYFVYLPSKQFENLDAVKQLDEDGSVIRLYMSGADVTPEILKLISQFSHLRVLNLSKSDLPETGFEHLQELKNLKLLHLVDTNVEDAHLAEIAKIASIEQLPLSGCKGVTDAGMKHVSELKNLIQLSLDGTSVTDKGITELKKLDKLKELTLVGCGKVTDAAVEHLSEMKSLTTLNILKTGISKEGAAKLKQVLPDCTIAN